VDSHKLEVVGIQKQLLECKKILIATGSRPFKPPIPGIEGSKVLDSDGVLALKTCPERIIIIGGGVIGVEFATIFSTLGKSVVIIEMMEMILPGIDYEIAAMTRRSLEKKGVEIHTSAKVTLIESNDPALCTFIQNDAEKQVSGDLVIVAIGRKPNTENMGLEKIGVATERGFIQIDDAMETSVSDIYAVGDITGKVQLAHFASAQGLVAASHAAGNRQQLHSHLVPSCIYTSPEISSVGLTESEALQTGRPLKIGRFPVNANGKSLICGESEGLVKIITDQLTGEILGAHLMAPRATDMIGEISVAMHLESTIEEIGETIHPHPTVAEMIKEAAHDVEGLCINKPRMKKI
jgi:dihydrolipoamide dehydrogenase